MGIKKLAETLQEIWELSIGDKKLILKRFKSEYCFDKLVLEKNNKEVYRLEINKENRQEFFYNTHFRECKNDKSSFIEYISMATQTEQFPKRDDAISNGLEEEFVWIYEERLRNILYN